MRKGQAQGQHPGFRLEHQMNSGSIHLDGDTGKVQSGRRDSPFPLGFVEVQCLRDTQGKCPGSYKAPTAGSAPGEKRGQSMRV